MQNNVHNINSMQDEEILDWKIEAAGIIRDVENHVEEIFISEGLVSTNFEIYLNLKTLENQEYCIRVSGSGFQVAGHNYDEINQLTDDPDSVYETPYALLSEISEGYIQSFANRLSEQLLNNLR